MNNTIKNTITVSGTPENQIVAAPGQTAYDVVGFQLYVKRFGSGAIGWMPATSGQSNNLYVYASALTASGTTLTTMMGNGNGPVTIDTNSLNPGDCIQFVSNGAATVDNNETTAGLANVSLVAYNGTESYNLLQTLVPLVAVQNPFGAGASLIYVGDGEFYGKLETTETEDNPDVGFTFPLNPNLGPWLFDMQIAFTDELPGNTYTPSGASVYKIDASTIAS